jgi:hypothetical protein
MKEELALLREVSKTAAQANLAQAEFWRNMSVRYGFVPEVVPEELTRLPRLTTEEYEPDLDSDSERHKHNCLFKIFIFAFYRYFGYSTLYECSLKVQFTTFVWPCNKNIFCVNFFEFFKNPTCRLKRRFLMATIAYNSDSGTPR